MLPVTLGMRRALFVSAMVLVLWASQITASRRYGYPQEPYTAALIDRLPKGLPIIFSSVGIFVETIFYENERAQLFTPIDWPITLEQAARNGGGVSGGNEMRNWRTYGVYAGHVLPTDELLRRFPDFVVISDLNSRYWLEERVSANPRYVVSYLGMVPAGLGAVDAWVVHTRAGAPALSLSLSSEPPASTQHGAQTRK